MIVLSILGMCDACKFSQVIVHRKLLWVVEDQIARTGIISSYFPKHDVIDEFTGTTLPCDSDTGARNASGTLHWGRYW
jgi:hypothetical protein